MEISGSTIEISTINGKTRVDLNGNHKGQYKTLIRLEFSFSQSLTLDYTTESDEEYDKDSRHNYIISNLTGSETTYQDEGDNRGRAEDNR